MTLNLNKTLPNREFMENIRRHQVEMLAELDAYRQEVDGSCRYHVFNWHRRSGKTAGIMNWVIKECIRTPLFQVVFALPSYKHGQNVYWNDTKGIQYWLPKEFDEKGKDVYVKTVKTGDMVIEFTNGSIIKFQSGKEMDSVRGIDADVVIFDEYAMFEDDTMWKEHFLPIVMADKTKMAIFISTPKGRNHFFDICEYGKDNPEWNVSRKTAHETDVFTKEALKSQRDQAGDILFGQEMMCNFLVDGEDIYIPFEIYSKGMTKDHWETIPRKGVMGGAIDPSEGGDECVIYVFLDGKIIDYHFFEPSTQGSLLPETIAHKAFELQEKHRFTQWIVDANGCGSETAGAMTKMGMKVYRFKGQEKPLREKQLCNRRIEAFYYVKQGFLRRELVKPTSGVLVEQLTSVKEELHVQSLKPKLESKKKYKQRTKNEADRADSYTMGIWATAMKIFKTQLVDTSTVVSGIRARNRSRNGFKMMGV